VVWQRIQQLFARSFCDSATSGAGDLPGIIGRLHHFRDPGKDAIRVTPLHVARPTRRPGRGL